MVGCHHRFKGHEVEQTSGDSERQRSPAGCSPWGGKESDTAERLNNKKESQIQGVTLACAPSPPALTLPMALGCLGRSGARMAGGGARVGGGGARRGGGGARRGGVWSGGEGVGPGWKEVGPG